MTGHWREDRLQQARDATADGRYADAAVDWLMEAEFTTDTLERQNGVRKAMVCAQLALRDSVEEMKASQKELALRGIDATAELSSTMKRAANAIHAAVRRETVKPARSEESAA